MESLNAFQREIHKQTASEQYAEALSYFKQHKSAFTKEDIAGNQYLIADMLKCLKLTGAYEAAGKFMVIYGVILNEDTPERVLNGWLLVLYDWYKSMQPKDDESGFVDYEENKASKQTQQNQEKIVRQFITLMPLLSKHTSEFAKDFYNLIVFKVLKSESRKEQINWKLINEFCKSIAPLKLKTNCQEVTFSSKGREKTTELASVLEEWYAQYSKSLFALGDYNLCLEICQEAFTNIGKMHYSNEIWFSRRMAQCLSKQGNIASAISNFEKIIAKKSDWFMLAELADLYCKLGKNKKAIHLMHQAMIQPGDLGFKVELVEKLGDLYSIVDNQELKMDHYRLAIAIRKSESWNIDPQLLEKAGSFDNIDAVEHRNKLFRKLQAIWKTNLTQNGNAPTIPQSNEQLTGKVISLSAPKEAGIDIRIKASNGKQYYAFIQRTSSIYAKVKEGVTLGFEVKPIPDRKLDKAIKIRYINQ